VILECLAQKNSNDANFKCGTTGYIAPEILRRECCTEKADIFSAGVLLHNMLIGQEPSRDSEFIKMVETNKRYSFDFSNTKWNYLSEEAKHLVLWMTNDDPQKRPTAKAALRHPWFLTQEKSIAASFACLDEEFITEAETKMNHCETVTSMSPKFITHVYAKHDTKDYTIQSFNSQITASASFTRGLAN
jgi:serine/threonine protein kinase